jgi:hypothetical protein
MGLKCCSMMQIFVPTYLFARRRIRDVPHREAHEGAPSMR